jgi:hypothetical protein
LWACNVVVHYERGKSEKRKAKKCQNVNILKATLFIEALQKIIVTEMLMNTALIFKGFISRKLVPAIDKLL